MEAGDGLSRLAGEVGARFDALSPQLRNAARYLLDHPDDVALRSMRDLAQAAGLPAVTFVRLPRALGYADWASLRRVFEDRLRQAPAAGGYSRKARDLQQQGSDDGTAALLKRLFGAELDNIELTFEKNPPAAMVEAAARIEQARRVFVLGQRSLYAPAFFLHYVYRLFRPEVSLLQGQGGTLIDDLRGIGPGDLLVALSVAPYTAEVVRATRIAAEQGAQVLAITDHGLSPIARGADAQLLVATGTPSFFHSIGATQALVQALLALLVSRGGQAALDAIAAAERQLDRFQAYWPEEGPQS